MSVLLLLLQIKLKVAQYAYKYSEELKTIFSEVSGWRSGYLLTSRCADTGSISRVGLAVSGQEVINMSDSWVPPTYLNLLQHKDHACKHTYIHSCLITEKFD